MGAGGAARFRGQYVSATSAGGLGGLVQLRDFGRLASGNSRILVWLRFRVVKLTKALKPEKSAQKRVQVSAQASDIRIFALTASAVRASS